MRAWFFGFRHSGKILAAGLGNSFPVRWRPLIFLLPLIFLAVGDKPSATSANPMAPSPESDQIRDIYAQAGHALYLAQCFEMSFQNLLTVHARLSNRSLTLIELESGEGEAQRQSLGGLLREVEQIAPFDALTDLILGDALQKCNCLAHRYFRERAAEIRSPEGRDRVIAELEGLQRCFQYADGLASSIAQSAGRILGITSN